MKHSLPANNFLTTAAQLLAGLRDLIAPARCIVCLEEGVWLCRNCRQNLPPPVTACIGCNTASARGLTCHDCRPSHAISGIISAGTYTNIAFRRGVTWLKFKGIRALAPEIASLIIPHMPMIAPLQELAEKAAVVPIPLHKNRLRQRGFNQSEDIARAISRFTNIQTANLLTRTKSTWTQSRLPHGLRSQNLMGAFAFNTSFDKQTLGQVRYLILLDDVATTGTTLEAAARVLRQAFPQATRIWAITAARG